MFSPEGYVSVKAIFDKFTLNWDWGDLNLDSIFEYTFEHEGGAFSAQLAAQFSKSEIFERAVFDLLNEYQLFMCAQGGGLYNLDANIFANTIHFRHLEVDPIFQEEYYEIINDWRSVRKVITDSLASGKDPWKASFDKLGFTSINLFYDRQNYLINCESYRDLQKYYLLNLGCFGLPMEIEAIEGFENYALCVKSVDAKELNFEKLKESIFKIAFDAVFGFGALDEHLIGDKKRQSSKVGRPQIRQEAAQAFLRHFAIDDHPPWKEVVKFLSEEEGINVSDRSIKRGLSQLSSDKTKTK